MAKAGHRTPKGAAVAAGERSVVEVEIYGQRYPLRTDGDEDYVRSLAAHVDRRMREVAESTSTVDSLKVAILAALNIADEYFQLKLEQDRIDDLISERTQAIAGLLEQELGAAG
jgi:cell division protein ZapA